MTDSLPDGRTLRRVVTVTVVGLLVAFSGCGALEEGVMDGPPETATDTDPTAVETPTPDETTASDGDGHDHGSDDGHDHGDGDEHSHGKTTVSDPDGTTANGSDGTNASAARSGKMTVVVAGSELPLAELATGDRVSIAPDDEHTWRADSNVTLSEALESFDADASSESATFDGTTYREGTDGTELHYRVNGRAIDPDSYVLRDGDRIWVTVETADTNYSVPGTYIEADQQHIHGQMEFVVDGEEIDFSEDRFQSGHRHFHFEGGHADPWHAHSWSVTLQYAMNTLSGINVTADSVTYDGTTYRAADSDSTVSITVNGEEVDPSEYLLKDGDDVRIVAESNES